MRATAGIIIVAVVAALGSLLTLAMGVLILVTFAVHPPDLPQMQLPGMRGLMLGIFGFYILLGACGLWTAIDLLRLKRWARYSIITFAAVLGVFSAIGALVSAFMNISVPQNAAAGFNTFMRIFIGGFYGVLLSISAWWVIYFTSASVKAQFESPAEHMAGAARRPVGVTVIAAFMLFGAASSVIAILIRMPMLLLGTVLMGKTAMLAMLAFLGANLYIGIGLLRMQEAARKITLGWIAFHIVNGILMVARPHTFEKLVKAYPWLQNAQSQAAFRMWPVVVSSAVIYLLYLGVAYYLIKLRPAFAVPASRPTA